MKYKMSLVNLTQVFQNNEGIRNINLDIHKGEILTLLGPSGCGKTTLLRVMGGFLKPQSGNVLLDGKDIAHVPSSKRPTAMVFQSYNLWPHMTVFENLAFGLQLRKIDKKRINREVSEILELVHMQGMEKKYPGQLSGGQQQRVAIARSLLIKPQVLFMDEPFSALDANIRTQMREELKRIQTELGITVVFVTHDQEEAMCISDRIAVMNQGGIEQIGTPSDIYDNPSGLYVARFIGGMNFFPQADGFVLAVRPEHISLLPPGEGDLQGTVHSTTIYGHYMETVVMTAHGAVKAISPRSHAPQPHKDAVGLLFSHKLLFMKAG